LNLFGHRDIHGDGDCIGEFGRDLFGPAFVEVGDDHSGPGEAESACDRGPEA
jgi:hypothetical protein